VSELAATFAALRAILLPYADALDIKADTATNLYLDTRHIQKNRKPLFFGAVAVRRRYVSFHLMPVYVQPALVATLSPALRKRMQGKSCFNFVEVDETLFKELAALTKAGFESYRKLGFV